MSDKLSKLIAAIRGFVTSALWACFSVPIFVKVLGIGLMVTALFGGVAFYQIQVGMYQTHYKVHGETALSVATSLATRLESRVEESDVPSIDAALGQTMSAFPDIRYIVVQDPHGNILSHGFTFPKEAPSDLVKQGDLCAACHAALSPTEIPSDLLEVPTRLIDNNKHIKAFARRGGLILEATVPISDKPLGSVRLGVGDKVIVREIASITRSLVWSLALCLAVSLSLALGLAYVLVRPIHSLLQTTNQLRQEDFSARAEVFSSDEIGQLAMAFNKMAEGLETFRREVHEKEEARQSLIGQIVQAQEEERKSVARELHDQLGQSLSNVLLTIESAGNEHPEFRPRCLQLKQEVRAIIDEVRRLAWHARPSILDDYGLDLALARYVEEVGQRVDFPIDYQCVPLRSATRMPDSVEITLYRIAQEGITNIIRHAEATQASIILLRQDQEVSLILEDNGKGFDVASMERSARKPPPLGLVGMKERAALVGGDLMVDSKPGKGTTLRVRIPLTM